MTISVSVKGRKTTPAKVSTRRPKADMPAWTKHGIHTAPDASLLEGKAAESARTDVVDISSDTGARSNSKRFHDSAVIRHADTSISRAHHHSNEIKDPAVLTPITSAFSHPNASAFEIARIGKETRKYVSANWARLSQGTAYTTRPSKVNVIRGCAVVLSLSGNPAAVEPLTIEDLTWISVNARRLFPHVNALRTHSDFSRHSLVILIDGLESHHLLQESSSAKRAMSAKRSAKSR